MKKAVLAIVVTLASVVSASAATKYWDINGATAGAGGASPAGTWDLGTTANWNTDSTGGNAGSVTTWAAQDDAIFSAGTDATGSYTVTLTGIPSVKSITVEEGGTILQGGNLTFAATAGVITVASGSTWNNSGAGSGDIAGTAGITKAGGGTLFLGSAETYTSASGAQLTITGGTADFSADLALGGTSTLTAARAAAVTINGGTLRYSGTSGITLATNRGLTIGSSGGTVEIPKLNAISGVSLNSTGGVFAGTGTLTKTGAGRLTFNNTAATFTGKIRVLSGLVNFGGDSRLGPAPSSAVADWFTLDGGGIRVSVTTTSTLNANRGITLGASGGKLVQPGPSTGNGLVYNGIIAGTSGGSLTIDWQDTSSTGSEGGGTGGIVTLGGANTYDGQTNINSGATLRIGAAGAIPDTSVVNFGSSTAVLDLGTNNLSETVKALNGTSGTVSLGTATITLNNPAGESFGGAINGTGSVVKNGSGTQTLSGTNSYTGATKINAGTLKLGASDVISNASGVVLADVAGAIFDVNGKTETVASLSGGGTNGGNVQLGSGALTLGDSSDKTYGGTISGSGTIEKKGSGAWTLTGASTYTGDTTVSGGTLVVNNTSGSATGFGTVAVTSGAKLAGTGALSGPVFINNGATLAPGTSIESLGAGALTFNTGGTFQYEINSDLSLTAAADLVDSNGDLKIFTDVALSIADAGTTVLAPGAKLTLISYAGAWNGGAFTGFADDTVVTIGVNQYTINYNDTTGGSNFGGGSYGNYVTLTAVPEASTMLFGGLMCLVCGLVHGGRRWLKARDA